ncbi:MAG: hypothetical protein SPI77_04360 [Corynebacterium sp.]|nr:hypothetical protein [Corynebacterium sp.]
MTVRATPVARLIIATVLTILACLTPIPLGATEAAAQSVSAETTELADTDLNLTKIWDDNNDALGARPDSVSPGKAYIDTGISPLDYDSLGVDLVASF